MHGTDPGVTGSGGWLEIRVDADSESVEAVAELFGRYGYNQGVVVHEPFLQDDDGDNLMIDPVRPVVVSTYLPVNEHLGEVLRRIEEGVWHFRQIGQVGVLQTLDRPEEEWANAWKTYFRVTRIGLRFVVRPSWLEYESRPGDLVISLDPGLAFGTGLHPTTDLCLRAMEDMDFTGRRVLDAGAGSGILSIAAARLGAGPVDAMEIDQVAIPALGSNIALNELTDRIQVIPGDVVTAIPSGIGYDLVVANIISRILIAAAGPLSAATRVGGQLLLSGVIETHEPDVVCAFSEVGFDVQDRRMAGDWIALLLVRR
jgi:ribosomal protein L11 methyltransferase